MSWCTIESDPGVFTELVERLGVRDVEFQELLTLDPAQMVQMGTVHAVVFLFKWRAQDYTPEAVRAIGQEDHSEHIFFARQTVNNACATQAIINALLNARTVTDLGQTLTEFKSFAGALPSEFRGDCIGNNDTIRSTHNSFANPDPFVPEERKSSQEDDDVFHFVSFLPIGNKVYELDGLKNAPIAIGTVAEGQAWYEVLIEHLQTRIARFAGDSIKFNLLAMAANQLDAARAKLAEVEAKIAAGDESEDATTTKSALEQHVQELAQDRERWQTENRRRRHNYVPFIMRLLSQLAKSGDLQSCYDDAESKIQEKVRAAAEKQKQEKAKEASKSTE